MRARGYFFHRWSLIALIAGPLLLVCVWQAGCKGLFKPNVTNAYNCRDRDIHVNPANGHGVDEDAIVVCGGQQVNWKDKGDQWQVDFASSPFQGGETTIKKGDPPHSAVKHLNDDTAFEYSITVNGTKHDPQIIIMGGT